MPRSQLQIVNITCGLCAATARYNEDMECIVGDWDIEHVQDPCSPGRHVPESELQHRIPVSCEDFQYPEEVKRAHRDRQFRRMFHVEPDRFERGVV